MRRINARALQNRRPKAAVWIAAAAGLLIAGCTQDGRFEGVYPEEPLPPAPAGEPLPYPSFQSRDKQSDDERGVLTPIEVEKLEESLANQAVTRPKGVERRIQGSSKAK